MTTPSKPGWKAGDVWPVTHLYRAKGVADGARRLPQVAARLEAFAAALRKRANEGWTLADTVVDDYINVAHPEHGVRITVSEAEALNAFHDVPDRLVNAPCEACNGRRRKARRRR